MFDLDKLTWLNGKYLRQLSAAELLGRLRGDLLSDAYLTEVLPLVQERIDTLEDFFEYARLLLRRASSPTTKPRPGSMVAEGTNAGRDGQGPRGARSRSSSTRSSTGTRRHARGGPARLLREDGLDAGELFMTVRVAVTGRAATPPLFETMAVLGKEVCRRRLRRAADALRSMAPRRNPLPAALSARRRDARIAAENESGQREGLMGMDKPDDPSVMKPEGESVASTFPPRDRRRA